MSSRGKSSQSRANELPKPGSIRARDIPFSRPSSQVILAPINYMLGMPSKRVCEVFTEALNIWVQAPESSVQIIKEAADLLQNASLIIDDVQDNSPIRRGKPAVHMVFGHAQALQAANFMTIQAMQAVRKLRNQTAIDVLLEEAGNLHLGQGLDVHCKFELKCPSEEEYLNMIDNKTGAFFRIISRLLEAEAEQAGAVVSLDYLMTLLGRFYQIRDDYMNLRSTLYASQKGSCEDLNEGKFSYPIVHCLTSSPAHRSCILGIFRQRPTSPGSAAQPLSTQAQNLILACLEESGSLKATLRVVNELQADLEAETARIENATGVENLGLKMLLQKFSLATETS